MIHCLASWIAVSLTKLMYMETPMTKPLSFAVCMAAATLAIQSGCQSTNKAPAAGPTIDAASADARIYVSGAD